MRHFFSKLKMEPQDSDWYVKTSDKTKSKYVVYIVKFYKSLNYDCLPLN